MNDNFETFLCILGGMVFAFIVFGFFMEAIISSKNGKDDDED